MLDLDYPIEFVVRDKPYNIKIIELSPKESEELDNMLSSENITDAQLESAYNLIVGGEDKEALRNFLIEHGLLGNAINKLLNKYIELKKTSLN